MPDATKDIQPICPHTALTPHWDSPGDMGKADLAVYTCEACGEKFNYEEAQQYLNKAPTVLTSVGPEDRR
jgi:hypothetical protein